MSVRQGCPAVVCLIKVPGTFIAISLTGKGLKGSWNLLMGVGLLGAGEALGAQVAPGVPV